MAGSYSSLREKRLKPSEEQAEHASILGYRSTKSQPPHPLERMWGLTLYYRYRRAYLRRLAEAFLAVAFWAG